MMVLSQNVMEVTAREQQFKLAYSTKHPSARIVFSVEEVLTGPVMVFLSLMPVT